MKLPSDAVMLLSVVNTALRDKYTNLRDMADSEGFDVISVQNKLSQIGYFYNEVQNRFM